MNKKNFELTVSIGDANTAALALRSYGLPANVAEEIITHESYTAIYNHGVVPQVAISPALIEWFGEQHIKEATSYAYLFMEDYGLDFDEYLAILSELLSMYRPEELILNPEKIRAHIQTSFSDSYDRLARSAEEKLQ